MNDLERLCIRERQLLEGKWKTHSLPARKKATANTNGTDGSTQTQPTYSYCRPTVSTEDVAKVPQQTQTVLLAYQYLDPHYRTYVLQPSTSTNSGEYLLPFESPRFKTAQHHFIVKTPCDTQKQPRNAETNTSTSKSKSHHDGGSRSYSVHLCPSCMQTSNLDNASLDAYDLASPCCDPHCVPTSRRRSRHKEHHRKDSKGDKDENHQRQRPHSQVAQTKQHYPAKSKYFNFSHGLVSQCSLHSCTSSELSGIAPNATGESSAASYTTSLSTDTLYWDNTCDAQGRRSSKSQPKVEYQYPSTSYDASIQYGKPKSWDNLTTKSYGGYGFGYGYVDSKHLIRKDGRPHSTRSPSCGQYIKSSNEKQVQTQSVYIPQTHYRYIHPTKSSENLLSVKFSSTEGTLSDSSLSCECLEAAAEMSEIQFFPTAHHSASGSMDSSYGGGSTRRLSKRHSTHDPAVVSTTSEITRL